MKERRFTGTDYHNFVIVKDCDRFEIFYHYACVIRRKER